MWKIAKYFFFVTLVQNSFQKLRIPIYGYPKKNLRNTQYFSQIFCTFSSWKYFIQIILISFHWRIICVKIGKNVWSWSRTRRNIKSCSYRWKGKTTPPQNFNRKSLNWAFSNENKKINRDDLTFLKIISFALVHKNYIFHISILIFEDSVHCFYQIIRNKRVLCWYSKISPCSLDSTVERIIDARMSKIIWNELTSL